MTFDSPKNEGLSLRMRQFVFASVAFAFVLVVAGLCVVSYQRSKASQARLAHSQALMEMKVRAETLAESWDFEAANQVILDAAQLAVNSPMTITNDLDAIERTKRDIEQRQSDFESKKKSGYRVADGMLKSPEEIERDRLKRKREEERQRRRAERAAAAEKLQRETAELLRRQEEELRKPGVFQVGPFEYTIWPAWWAKDQSSGLRTWHPEQRFLVVEMEVLNRGKEPGGARFPMLIDNSGARYLATSLIGHESNIKLGIYDMINPRDSVRGLVFFDVHQDRIYQLLVSDGSVFDSGTLVPLRIGQQKTD